MTDLHGRRALVTGGASGIGAACARELASAGAWSRSPMSTVRPRRRSRRRSAERRGTLTSPTSGRWPMPASTSTSSSTMRECST